MFRQLIGLKLNEVEVFKESSKKGRRNERAFYRVTRWQQLLIAEGSVCNVNVGEDIT
jgi:hypothetical protein